MKRPEQLRDETLVAIEAYMQPTVQLTRKLQEEKMDRLFAQHQEARETLRNN